MIRNDILDFSIPLRWSTQYVREMLSVEHTDRARLGAFYGCINISGFRSGRIPLEHQSVSLVEASEVIRCIHDEGREFFYLFNAPLPAGIASLDCVLLEEIISTTECDAVVVADFRLAELIRSKHEKLSIHVSTVADVRRPEDLSRWCAIKPQRLVLHHDLPRQPNKLRRMIDSMREHGVDPEMMVTESCLFKCPFRSDHYQALGAGMDDASFHAKCRAIRMSSPETILSCGSFVRPQDVRKFQRKFGIEHFKITGRSQTTEWIVRAASAYLNESFDGNLVELMGMDPSIFPEKSFGLDSAILDGYVERLFDADNDDVNETIALNLLKTMEAGRE